MNEMTRLYSPSLWVPNKSRDEVMNDFFAKISGAFDDLNNDRNVSRKLDVIYGENEHQKVDIWGNVTDKLLIFIHGGYWAAGTRKDCLTPARCALDNGWAIASVGYGLAVNGRNLTETVNDAVRAVEFLLEMFPNVTNVIVGGHSAGAHLAVQAVTRLRKQQVRGMLLFSGCYFLEDLVDTEIGADINLTLEEAEINSCRLSSLNGLILRTLVVLGLQEAPKLVEQNRTFVEKRDDTEIAEFNFSSHFTIMTNLMDENSGEYKAMSKFLKSF